MTCKETYAENKEAIDRCMSIANVIWHSYQTFTGWKAVITAFVLMSEFSQYDDSFYTLDPDQQGFHCVGVSSKDLVEGQELPRTIKFYEEPIKNYPELVCNDDRLPPANWTGDLRSNNSGSRGGSANEGSLSDGYGSISDGYGDAGGDERRLGRSVRKPRQLFGDFLDSSSTSTDWLEKKDGAWVSDYVLEDGSETILKVYSFCAKGYYCSRDREAYGYDDMHPMIPARPTPANWVLCVSMASKCGDNAWCGQFSDLEGEGDHGLHNDNCAGCIKNGKEWVDASVYMVLAGSVISTVTTAIEWRIALKMMKENPYEKQFDAIDIVLKIAILWAIVSTSAHVLFENLRKADCLGPDGAEVMVKVEDHSYNFYEEVLLFCIMKFADIVKKAAKHAYARYHGDDGGAKAPESDSVDDDY